MKNNEKLQALIEAPSENYEWWIGWKPRGLLIRGDYVTFIANDIAVM